MTNKSSMKIISHISELIMSDVEEDDQLSNYLDDLLPNMREMNLGEMAGMDPFR